MAVRDDGSECILAVRVVRAAIEPKVAIATDQHREPGEKSMIHKAYTHSRTVCRVLLLSLLVGCGSVAARPAAPGPGSTQPQAQQAQQAQPTPPAAPAPTVPPTPPSRVSHEQAMADARRLIELLESSHPDPYSPVGGKVVFKRSAAMLLQLVPPDDVDVGHLRNLLDGFLAQLSDGHTHMEREAVSWYAPPDALPIELDVTVDGLHVVASDVPEMKGTRGYRVLGVNGLPIDELAKRWARLSPIENRFHAYAQLQRVLTSPALIARIVTPSGSAGHLSLDLSSPNGKRETRSLPIRSDRNTADRAKWIEPAVRVDVTGIPAKDEPFFFRFLREDKVAYLRVATIMGREAYEIALREGWGDPRAMIERYYAKKGQAAPADIEAALSGIPSFLETTGALLGEMKKRGTQTLVVDLQSNNGGVTPMVRPFLHQMYGDAYYGHDFPIQFVTVFSQLYLDKYHKDLETLRAEQGNPNLQLGDYGFEAKEEGSAETKRKKAIEEYTAKKMSFAARLRALGGEPIYSPPNVVVLCDEGTFSAAFHFLFFLRDLGASVVGVTPGQAPNTFMEMTEFTLPNSRLRGSISNSVQTWVTEPRAQALVPDVVLTYELAKRYRFATDAVLQLALDRIAKGSLRKR